MPPPMHAAAVSPALVQRRPRLAGQGCAPWQSGDSSLLAAVGSWQEASRASPSGPNTQRDVCALTWLCLTLCDPMYCSPPGSSVRGDSPGGNTGVGCHVLLQRIFLTQGSNLSLLRLQHCRWNLYHGASGEAPQPVRGCQNAFINRTQARVSKTHFINHVCPLCGGQLTPPGALDLAGWGRGGWDPCHLASDLPPGAGARLCLRWGSLSSDACRQPAACQVPRGWCGVV